MNAFSHREFDLPLADLIAADKAYWDDLHERGVDAEHLGPHKAVMSARCHTLQEVRAKLTWLAAEGGLTVGIEDALLLLAEDIDRLPAF